MRLDLDAGWLHLDFTIGPDEPERSDRSDTQLDAYVEQGNPDPHRRAEMDGRRGLGFGT